MTTKIDGNSLVRLGTAAVILIAVTGAVWSVAADRQHLFDSMAVTEKAIAEWQTKLNRMDDRIDGLTRSIDRLVAAYSEKVISP